MVKKLFTATILIINFVIGIAAQTERESKDNKKPADEKQAVAAVPLVPLNEKDPPSKLAESALKAHGGDKLKNLQSLILRGKADVTPPNFPQSIPGTFVIVQSGEKGRLQLDLTGFGFTQIFDGENTSSTLTAITLPPLTRYGLLTLAKIGESGYTVAESTSKKPFSFSLKSPGGDVLDYVLDPKTGRVKSCVGAFLVNGNKITTALEYGKYKEVDAVVLPEEFFQRIEFGQVSAYVTYKSNVIMVNSKIDDDVFLLKTGK